MIKGLLRATYETAKLPVDVVKDVVTLGGIATDEESSVKKRLEKIDNEIQETLKD
ncbi:hypothetical protein WMO13_06610 [Ignatzschineria larvae DSM 13226]|uniref:Uncharacterized protein n=1 Tax=Ignatzschineria larvae DSM 13226 TaxID=1111732 RepID=A0ABZ3BY77_9GAMM|nr:hypothetical protein [Ignatzschineria larvae]